MVNNKLRYLKYPTPRERELTQEQIEMIEAARERGYVYDEDAPETDPVKTPERYAAMMKAVAERNRRIAEMAKAPA